MVSYPRLLIEAIHHMAVQQEGDSLQHRSVWAVVVHYGDPRVTTRLLEHLESSTVPMSIVVVDNSGHFDSPARVQQVRTTSNLGFAGGANVGARLALANGADLVWFINNDAEPGPDALERLMETVQCCTPACVVGSLEIDPEDSDPQSQWAYRVPALPSRLRGLVRAVRGRLSAVDFVSGFSMIVSRPAFDLVGFFDESFFHFFEDVDYCLRAVLRGVDVVLDCGAPINHRRSTALGKGSQMTSYYFFRNRLLLTARYRGVHPLVSLFISDPRHCVLPLISPRRIARRDWPWLRGAWRGTIDGVRGRTGPVAIL